MSKRKLYIITDSFPYGKGEKTFVLPEIEILKNDFAITIVSAASSEIVEQKERLTKLDDSIKVFRFCPQKEKKALYYINLLLFWTKKVCFLEVKNILKIHEKVWVRIWKSMHFYARAESLYYWIKKNRIIDQEQGIFYSYWYNDRVLAMTMHKDNYPNLKIITRAHGFDLFDERQESTLRQPFKQIMDSKTDKVIFISDYNYTYYLNRLSKQSCEKYSVYRIGALKAERFPEAVDRKTVFRIISCSNLIKLKRVPLIIDALDCISDVRIEWTHFGSGNEGREIKKYAKKLDAKDNITYSFKGYVPRKDIYEYYQTTYVHCFINLSESEGSPVSIQEALAFGIPVIGTDVGGVSEMIDGNGYLLTDNPAPEEIACRIKMLANLNEEAYADMRKRSLEIWRQDYDQIENAKRFRDFLLTV